MAFSGSGRLAKVTESNAVPRQSLGCSRSDFARLGHTRNVLGMELVCGQRCDLELILFQGEFAQPVQPVCWEFSQHVIRGRMSFGTLFEARDHAFKGFFGHV